MGLKEVFLLEDLGNNKIGVHTPYNPAFISEMRKLPGSVWNAKTRTWIINDFFIDAVRRTMRNVYGHDDLAEETGFTVRIKCNTDVFSTSDAVVILGHTVAYASAKGGRTFPGEGVNYLSGGCKSVLNPETPYSSWITKVLAGSVIEISNVTESMIDHDRKMLEDANISIMVDPAAYQLRREELLAERSALATRLQEIDAELSKISSESFLNSRRVC